MKKFPFLTVALVGLVSVTVATNGRSDKWWWDYGGGPASSKFVPLDQIKKSNVAKLEVAWFYPHGTTGFNPVIVEDVMYVLGRNNSLIALDATTGKEIWIHEGLSGIITRGVNYWQSEDGKDRRLLFSINGYLQAIDARTGKSILTFGNNGIVDLREGLRRAEGTDRRVQSRTPGKIWKNLLIMGSAAGEAWVTPPGDIRAYDVVTGKRVWQFHTVPEPGEFGYDTWPKEAYKYVGGANNWGEMSIDEERGIVYVPTGSATYDFYGADRHGDEPVRELHPRARHAHRQAAVALPDVHHDLWDLDNVSAPQLITVQHKGKRVDAVAHAGKTGFLYVFNRVTGEPLWPIEERPVPKSDVPGEQAWPTQPFPTVLPPFAKMDFTVDDVNPWLLSPEQYETMKARVAKARNEGPFTPPAFIDTISMPGNQGGSNWGTTAANPKKGIVYVVNVNQVALLKLEDVKTGEPVAAARMPGSRLSAILPGLSRRRHARRPCRARTEPRRHHRPDGRRRDTRHHHGRQGHDASGAGHLGRGDEQPDSVSGQPECRSRRRWGGGRGRGGRGGGPPLPPGPVVASGGAPLPQPKAVDPDPPQLRYEWRQWRQHTVSGWPRSPADRATSANTASWPRRRSHRTRR